MTAAPIPVVVYGVKSSPDEKESVADQHRRVIEKIEQESGRFLFRPPFGERNASGFHRERGAALEAAMAAAIQAAREHGEAELWVFHSSRLSRGSGRRGQRGLTLIHAQLAYEDVQVRSVEDDEFVRNKMLVGVADEQNHKYSADLSAHVRRGKRDKFERGKFTNGRPRDGYTIRHINAPDGRKIDHEVIFDPPRAAVWRRIFALAREGVEDGKIARRLNKEGHRTRSNRYFDRRAIADGLTSQFYAGRLVFKPGTDDEEMVEGEHPALIPPADFDALQARRQRRREDTPAAASGRRRGAGRPPRNHALANLAVCGVCGARMRPQTSNYVRKDGTRRRYYQCSNQLSGAGCAGSVVSAELVDAALVAELDRLLIDFDAWRDQIEAGQCDERTRLRAELERAEREHAEQAERHAAVLREWVDFVAAGERSRADLVLPAVEHERDALVRAERRLIATRDALDSIPERADSDALLDFGNALKAAVRGRLDEANGSMEAVNRGLCEVFHAFVLREESWWGTENGAVVWDHPTRRGITIAPVVRLEIAQSLGDAELPWMVGDEDAAPPLRWLTVPDEDPRGAPDPHSEDNSDLLHPSRSQISRYERPSARSVSAVSSCGFSRCSASAVWASRSKRSARSSGSSSGSVPAASKSTSCRCRSRSRSTRT